MLRKSFGTVNATILVCLTFLTGTIGVLPGRYLMDTGSIGFGETICGSIDPAGEVDTYTFSASAGDTVVVRMSKTSGGLDPEVGLYDPGGSLLVKDLDFHVAEISCFLAIDGEYTILASDWDGDETGNYCIFVQRICNFELHLSAGWNMVSFSCLPDDPSFSNILGVCGFYQALTWYCELGMYVDVSSGDVEAGWGYWVLVLEDCTVVITGLPVDSYERDLCAGWGMICSIACTVDGDCVFPGFYQLLTWDGTSYVQSTTIETGKGYWALVLEETHIVVDESCCIPS